MKIVVAGGTGFLGGALTQRLAGDGHDVVVLSRGLSRTAAGVRSVTWVPDGTAGTWARELDGAAAVINLAGAGIADQRWSDARKQELLDSRVNSTRSLVAAIGAAAKQPAVFLSGSAIGYYGTSETETFNESSSPAGSDFLAELCARWEAEANQASALGCRVVLIRTGIVLARDGGALKKMILPFLLCAGGPIASGRQVMSWIHRDDWTGLIRWALTNTSVRGALNATAPNPATNREFMRALGRALHRPSLMPMPAFALRLLVGEMADVALINGQRVVPRRALELGFTFQYPDLEKATIAAVDHPRDARSRGKEAV